MWNGILDTLETSDYVSLFLFYLGFNFNLGLAIKDESDIVGCGKTSLFLISFDPILC